MYSVLCNFSCSADPLRSLFRCLPSYIEVGETAAELSTFLIVEFMLVLSIFSDSSGPASIVMIFARLPLLACLGRFEVSDMGCRWPKLENMYS